MSILIDELVHRYDSSSITSNKNGKWYIAKPLPFNSLYTRWNRIKDALSIIRGTSFAVHFKEDEKEEQQ